MKLFLSPAFPETLVLLFWPWCVLLRKKQYKLENASRENQKLIILTKNGLFVKLNKVFLKKHKIQIGIGINLLYMSEI